MYRDENLIRENGGTAFNPSAFMTGVYGWMTFALIISGFVAVLAGTSPAMVMKLASGPAMILLILAELGLVIWLSAGINRMAASTASALFALYAAVNGLTLSFIFVFYTIESIAATFFITAGTFGVMAFYGSVTKRDLSKFGSILTMALFGLIIASIVNIFWANDTLFWIITYAGVLIFVGLTAWDVQKIRKLHASLAGDAEVEKKIAVLGALTLYLDFVNLFLYLLRIFGKRR